MTRVSSGGSHTYFSLELPEAAAALEMAQAIAKKAGRSVTLADEKGGIVGMGNVADRPAAVKLGQ